MIAHMNPRQFKKLCAKCHALVVRIKPTMANITYKPSDGYDADYWHAPGVLKGTKGFGSMSGYYEREWSDESAWEALNSRVYWHFAEFKNKCDPDEMYPTYPADIWPRTWQDVLALGERMALECAKGGAA